MQKVLNLLLAKTTTVAEVLGLIAREVDLEEPTTDEAGHPYPVERRLRLLEVFSNRVYRVYDYDMAIDKINDQYWTVRAEEIPQGERHVGPDDRVVHVRHFFQDAKATSIHNFGEAILLLVTATDTVAEVRERLKHRGSWAPAEWNKIRLAVINFGRVEYLSESARCWLFPHSPSPPSSRRYRSFRPRLSLAPPLPLPPLPFGFGPRSRACQSALPEARRAREPL